MFTAPPLPLIATQIAVYIYPALTSSVRKRSGKVRQQGRVPWYLESLIASGRTVTQTSSGSSTYVWPDGRAEVDSGTGTDSVGLSIFAQGKFDAKYRWAGEPGSEPPSKVYARIRVRAEAKGWGDGRYAVANGGRDNQEGDDSFMAEALSTGPKYKEVAGSTLIKIPGALATASSGGYAGRSYISFQYDVLPQFLLSYLVGDQVLANYRKGADGQRIENKRDKDGKMDLDIAMRLSSNVGGITWVRGADVSANNPDYTDPEWNWMIPVTPDPNAPPSGDNGFDRRKGQRQIISVNAGRDPGEGASSPVSATVTDATDDEAPSQNNDLNVRWHYPYEGWKVKKAWSVWDEPAIGPDGDRPRTARVTRETAYGRYFCNGLRTFEEQTRNNVVYTVLKDPIKDVLTIGQLGRLKYVLGFVLPDSLEDQSHLFEVNFYRGWQRSVVSPDGNSIFLSTIEGGDWNADKNRFIMTPVMLIGYDCKVWTADNYSATGYNGVSSHSFANYNGHEDFVGNYNLDPGFHPTPGGGTGGGPPTVGSGL